MDGVTVSVLGALAALVVAIVLILKKVQPTYAMLIGAVAGGLIGGAGLTGTVNYIISGTQGIVSAIIRIVTAGILAGALIESGAAERIAEAIMNKLGAKRCLIAITLATWVLTAVGVFGDVACITVAPIALQMAKRAGYHKMGVLMAQLGAVRAGNVMSPNPNDIAAAEGFGVPLTSIIAVGIIPAVVALIVTSLLAYHLRMRGTEIADSDVNTVDSKDLPPLWAALAGPFVTIAILVLRPIAGITIDPLIALPVGGIVSIEVFQHAVGVLVERPGAVRGLRPFIVRAAEVGALGVVRRQLAVEHLREGLRELIAALASDLAVRPREQHGRGIDDAERQSDEDGDRAERDDERNAAPPSAPQRVPALPYPVHVCRLLCVMKIRVRQRRTLHSACSCCLR